MSNVELNEETGEVELTEEMEFEMLMERANQLGLKPSPRIKLPALREKVNEALAEPKEEEPDFESMTKVQRATAIREKMKREQLRLVRVRIANLNPDKSDLPGEIFTVVNKYLGSVKKYIPYGEATDEGYHIPFFIFTQLKSRKFLQKKTKQNKNTGNIDVSTRWVPEFALEELPQLTQKELEKLANVQRASAGLD